MQRRQRFSCVWPRDSIEPSRSINCSREPVISKLFCAKPGEFHEVEYQLVAGKQKEKRCYNWSKVHTCRSQRRDKHYQHDMLCLNSSCQIWACVVNYRRETSVGSSQKGCLPLLANINLYFMLKSHFNSLQLLSDYFRLALRLKSQRPFFIRRSHPPFSVEALQYSDLSR